MSSLLDWHRDVADAPIVTAVVHENEILRRGLRKVLVEANGFTLACEVADPYEAMIQVPAARPDVVLIGLHLPGCSGVEVCRSILSADPQIRAVLLATEEDEEPDLWAIMAGASGYVLREISVQDLSCCLWRVADGEVLRGRDDSLLLLEKAARRAGLATRLASSLERRILELIADGMTNREISEHLGIARSTTEAWVNGVLLKLGLTRDLVLAPL